MKRQLKNLLTAKFSRLWEVGGKLILFRDGGIKEIQVLYKSHGASEKSIRYSDADLETRTYKRA